MDTTNNLWGFSKSADTKQGYDDENKRLWEALVFIVGILGASGLIHTRSLTYLDLLGEGTSFTVRACKAPPNTHPRGKVKAVKWLKPKKNADHVTMAEIVKTEMYIMTHEPLQEHDVFPYLLGYHWLPDETVPRLIMGNAFYGTLDRYLEATGGFEGARWRDCHHLSLGIARGVEALHANAIIHGDIKPQNVLVVINGAGPHDPDARPKAELADFSHSISGINMQANQNPTYLGTPLFNPPEILRSTPSKSLTLDELSRCDSWSYGLTLWCLISGKGSYFQESWLEIHAGQRPSKLDYLLSQPSDFLQKKFRGALRNQGNYQDMPRNLRDLFSQVLEGCLASGNPQRLTMRQVSMLLDDKKDYYHDAANFLPGDFSKARATTYAHLAVHDFAMVACPWQTQQIIFKGLELSRKAAANETSPLAFRISPSDPTSSISSVGSHIWNLAQCYMYGLGTKSDLSVLPELLEYLSRFPWNRGLLGQIKRYLTECDERLHHEEITDNGWLSQEVRRFNKLKNDDAFAKPISHVEIPIGLAVAPGNVKDVISRIPNRAVGIAIHFIDGSTKKSSLLKYAIDNNDIQLMRQLIHGRFPIDHRDESNRTPLLEACSLGRTEIVNMLLDYGVNASIRDDMGISALHYLVFFDPIEVSKLTARLMASGADFNARTRAPTALYIPDLGLLLFGSPLFFAVICRNYAVAEALLQAGVDPNLRVTSSMSALDLAVSLTMPDMCQLLLEYGANVGTYWMTGKSPLHWLGENYASSLWGMWAMHGAAYHQAISSTIDLMISQGVVIDQVDSGSRHEPQKRSALGHVLANRTCDIRLASCLIEKQISLGRQFEARLLLDSLESSRDDHENCPKFLLLWRRRHELEWKNVPRHLSLYETGDTLLHQSVERDALAVAREILRSDGAQVDSRNTEGLTALHYACKVGSKDAVQLLIEQGAAIEQRGIGESLPYTALGFAVQEERLNIISILLARGADPWMGNQSVGGPTVLHLAAGSETPGGLRTPGSVEIDFGKSNVIAPEDSFLLALLEELLAARCHNTATPKSIIDAVHPRYGTCLHLAVRGYDIGAVEMILAAGGEANICDSSGITPLGYAERMLASACLKEGQIPRAIHDYLRAVTRLLKT